MTYIVIGECNKCGECCWYHKGYPVTIVRPPCFDEKTNLCKIYEIRPKGCREFPTVKHFLKGQVPKKCSYKLKEVR